jgi:hypothetical protein
MVLVVGALTVTSLAAEYASPAELVAALTGQTAESVAAQRQETGETCGAIAAEAGKLEEFKAGMLEMKKARLSERVEAGTITQERADEILAAMEQHQENCDGTGSSARIGQSMGAAFGGKTGARGANQGAGRGGFGQGLCTGTEAQ